MASTTQTVTADELFRMPDNGGRHELVRGGLRSHSMSGGLHGQVTARVTMLLSRHVRDRELGVGYAATGFQLASDPDTVLAPDLAIVVSDRAMYGGTDSFFPGPPDLAVEVISPSESYSDVEEKSLIQSFFE